MFLDKLAISRALYERFRELAPVKLSSRNVIVRDVLKLLQEKPSCVAIKADFREFYESISRKKVLSHLLEKKCIDNELYDQAHHILSEENLPGSNGGVPRGLVVSSLLCEHFMEEFDESVRNIKGVFYYARYVDDIVILTDHNCVDLRKKLSKICPEGLEFNKRKSFFSNCMCTVSTQFTDCLQCQDCRTQIQNVLQPPVPPRQFDLLGYNIRREMNGAIDVAIAPSKIAKIKNRIVTAFVRFMKNRNEGELVAAMEYLSSNHRLYLDAMPRYNGLAIVYREAINSPRCHKQMDELTFFFAESLELRKDD